MKTQETGRGGNQEEEYNTNKHGDECAPIQHFTHTLSFQSRSARFCRTSFLKFACGIVSCFTHHFLCHFSCVFTFKKNMYFRDQTYESEVYPGESYRTTLKFVPALVLLKKCSLQAQHSQTWLLRQSYNIMTIKLHLTFSLTKVCFKQTLRIKHLPQNLLPTFW